MGHECLTDKRLSAEEMAVGGDLHWDLLVKQGHRERENQGIVCGVRDNSWSLFFFSLCGVLFCEEREK